MFGFGMDMAMMEADMAMDAAIIGTEVAVMDACMMDGMGMGMGMGR